MSANILNPPHHDPAFVDNKKYQKHPDGDEYYLISKDKKVIFSKDQNGIKYARDRHGNEFYPIIDGVPILIKTSEGWKYAKDSKKNEFYPKDIYDNDIPVFDEKGNIKYAVKDDGTQIYPKNNTETEQLYGTYAKDANGNIVYPLNSKGQPIYKKNPNTKSEYYSFDPKTKLLTIGKNANGDQVYAKDENEDEFYPAPLIHAKSRFNIPLYATTKNGTIIFPKFEDGEEYYLQYSNKSDIIDQNNTIIPRYAKTTLNEEIYPRIRTFRYENKFKEIYLRIEYAKSFNNKPMYPLDEYGNEYTIEIYKNDSISEIDSYPISYPITNDNWVIVPNIKGKPYISQNMIPLVAKENILGKLYRDGVGYHDYITNIPSLRKSRSSRKGYKFLPTGKVKPEYRLMYLSNFDPYSSSNISEIANVISKEEKRPSPKKQMNMSIIILIIFLLILGIFFSVKLITKH